MMLYLQERGRLRASAMERQPDRDRIAEEAVGQRHESAPPYAGTKARHVAGGSGPAIRSGLRGRGEDSGENRGSHRRESRDAYSDPESVARHSPRKVGQQIAARGESHKDGGSNHFLSAPVEAAKARPLMAGEQSSHPVLRYYRRSK